MKNKTSIHYLFFILLCGVSFSLSSCSEETAGCTSSDSINFDSNASIDDGSCLFLRNNYLGNFSGTIDSSNDIYDDNEFGIRISENSNGSNQVTIAFTCCPRIKFDGIVTKNKININSQVEVTNFPSCNGTTPFNGTPFNGFVEWKVDFNFSEENNCLSFSNLVERYLDEQQTAICINQYTGKLARS